jgi:hypothetical protein
MMMPFNCSYRNKNEANATSPRAAHCIPTSSQRIGPRIASRASQRIASHPVYRIPCIAAHCIANNPHTVQRTARTDNQPAAHRPPRTAHTSHLQLCTRFAVLCARLFGSWD